MNCESCSLSVIVLFKTLPIFNNLFVGGNECKVESQ